MDVVLQTLLLTLSVCLTLGAVTMGIFYLIPVWDFLAERQMGKLALRYEQLGLDPDWLRLCLRFWSVAMTVTLLVLWFVCHMPPFAIVVTLIIAVAPRRILDRLISRRSHLYRDQMAVAAVALANAARSGLSPAHALKEVAAETPKPLCNELARVVNDYENGRPLGEALMERRTALDVDSFTFMALSIETVLQKGGKVTQTLSRLATSLEEELRLRNKIDTDTSAGQQTILLLSIFPILFLLFGLFALPEGTQLLFTNFYGQCTLSVIVLLIYFGYGYAIRILNCEI